MSLKTFRIALTISVLIAPLAASAADEESRLVRAVITDDANAPVQNALVELICPQKGGTKTFAKSKSDAEGRVHVETRSPPSCKIRITAPGFKSAVIPVSFYGSAQKDLGQIHLSVSCIGPRVFCDEVTPKPKP